MNIVRIKDKIHVKEKRFINFILILFYEVHIVL